MRDSEFHVHEVAISLFDAVARCCLVRAAAGWGSLTPLTLLAGGGFVCARIGGVLLLALLLQHLNVPKLVVSWVDVPSR